VKPQDIQDLVEYALDHWRHFEAWPVEFEAHGGTVYTATDYWPLMVALEELL
jgi:hypothetical protein